MILASLLTDLVMGGTESSALDTSVFAKFGSLGSGIRLRSHERKGVFSGPRRERFGRLGVS